MGSQVVTAQVTTAVTPPVSSPETYARKTSDEEHEDQVPIIDLASSRTDLMTGVKNACQWGFFYLVNHGSSGELLRKLSSEAKGFFALPLDEKVCYRTPDEVEGSIFFGGGSKGDWRDVLKINCAPASAVEMDLWPLQPVGFKQTLKEYFKQHQQLANRLLEIISESLGLEKDYITAECADQRIVMAINHYPPCPDPSLAIGIREHSDPCTITILLQDDIMGLQVYKRDKWVDVRPMKDALVVNVGDHLQMLSNGRYSSCLHRVVNSAEKSRTSTALFLSPALTAQVKPAPALIDENHPAVYRELMYGEFLKSFYRGGGPNKQVALFKYQKN